MAGFIRRNIRELGLASLVLGVAASLFCWEMNSKRAREDMINRPTTFVEYKTHPVDQVFDDSGCYDVHYADKEGLDIEVRYGKGSSSGLYASSKLPSDVPVGVATKFKYLNREEGGARVIHDLEPGQRGHVEVLIYRKAGSEAEIYDQQYTEIHIPKGGRIEPGEYQILRNKAPPINVKMHEIK